LDGTDSKLDAIAGAITKAESRPQISLSIVRFEAGRAPRKATIERLKATLMEKGVLFISEISGVSGPLVGLRAGMSVPPASDEDEIDDTRIDGGPEDLTEALKAYWADGAHRERLSAPGSGSLLKRS
jgi:hypothetical protein